METNKDFLLRNIEKLNELVQILSSISKKKDEISVPFNNFILEEFNISVETFFSEEYDLAQSVHQNNFDISDAKNLANILEMLLLTESNCYQKKLIAKKIITLLTYVGIKSKIYSVENNYKIDQLSILIQD